MVSEVSSIERKQSELRTRKKSRTESIIRRPDLCPSRSSLYILSFNHLGNFEEHPVGIRRICQRLFASQRLAQSFRNIFSAGIGESLGSRLRSIHAVAGGDLSHRRHVRGVQFIEPFDVVKNRVQVSHHPCLFFLREFQIGQAGNVGDILLSDFHNLLPVLDGVSSGAVLASCATTSGATTTNSIRDTVCPAYRLIVATYRGANACNSRLHP